MRGECMFSGNLQLDFGDFNRAGRYAALLGVLSFASDTVQVTLRIGYMSDGASVPRFLWWFLPPWGDRATLAALVHDYLLDRLQGFEPGGPVLGAESREKCDRQFLLALRTLGVAEWRARAAWLGVRAHSIRLELFGQADKPISA